MSDVIDHDKLEYLRRLQEKAHSDTETEYLEYDMPKPKTKQYRDLNDVVDRVYGR